MSEMKPTKVEWWPLPRPGEVVPDYPPQDITHCIASGTFVKEPVDAEAWEAANPTRARLVDAAAVERFMAACGMPPLAPWQRRVIDAAAAAQADRVRLSVLVDATAFERGLAATRAAIEEVGRCLAGRRPRRIRRMHELYRRRQLARRRRSR